MKAMILAAGLGTRLRPLTDDRPKALVPVAGKPLLEWVIRRFLAIGVTDIVINVHHLAGMIADFLEERDNFGVDIRLSWEEEVLGTGGGIKHAEGLIRGSDPFFVHNVDVISDIDLPAMYEHHRQHDALATLATSTRDTSRPLIVDEHGLVCGHLNKGRDLLRMSREPEGAVTPLAFQGIHVISPAIFDLFDETARFSIVTCYLRLIKEGADVVSFPTDQYYWKDAGIPDRYAEIERDVVEGMLSL